MLITVRVYPRPGIKEDDIAKRMFYIRYGVESRSVSINGKEYECWTVDSAHVDRFLEICSLYSISVEVFAVVGGSLMPWGSTIKDKSLKMAVDAPARMFC